MRIITMNPLSKSLTWRQKFHALITTFFGAGLAPIAPGTVGSLAALIPFWWMQHWPIMYQLATIFAVTVLGTWSIGRFQKQLHWPKDDGRFVIDEVAGCWLAMLGSAGRIEWMLAGFFLFRVLDITKPYPANWMDNQGHTPIWVMGDDIVCGIYACGLMHLVSYLSVFA
jgi:phosphatidylglycerophosphatase A